MGKVDCMYVTFHVQCMSCTDLTPLIISNYDMISNTPPGLPCYLPWIRLNQLSCPCGLHVHVVGRALDWTSGAQPVSTCTIVASLYCTGEAVSPEECFTVSGYPSFLPSLTECSHGHLSHPPPLHPHIPTTSVTPTAETRRSENCVPMVEEKQVPLVKKPSAFTPVDTNRASYVTPDLFAEPVVGKAIASSTPAPRALAFTRSDSGNEVGMANRVGVASSGGGCVDVGSVRMVLDFGSAPKSSGVESSEGHGTPMFGTLPPPPQGTCTPAVGTPSQSSPSPAPAHFTRQLLTAPVAPKKRVSVNFYRASQLI